MHVYHREKQARTLEPRRYVDNCWSDPRENQAYARGRCLQHFPRRKQGVTEASTEICLVLSPLLEHLIFECAQISKFITF